MIQHIYDVFITSDTFHWDLYIHNHDPSITLVPVILKSKFIFNSTKPQNDFQNNSEIVEFDLNPSCGLLIVRNEYAILIITSLIQLVCETSNIICLSNKRGIYLRDKRGQYATPVLLFSRFFCARNLNSRGQRFRWPLTNDLEISISPNNNYR